MKGEENEGKCERKGEKMRENGVCVALVQKLKWGEGRYKRRQALIT